MEDMRFPFLIHETIYFWLVYCMHNVVIILIHYVSRVLLCIEWLRLPVFVLCTVLITNSTGDGWIDIDIGLRSTQVYVGATQGRCRVRRHWYVWAICRDNVGGVASHCRQSLNNPSHLGERRQNLSANSSYRIAYSAGNLSAFSAQLVCIVDHLSFNHNQL